MGLLELFIIAVGITTPAEKTEVAAPAMEETVDSEDHLPHSFLHDRNQESTHKHEHHV